LRDQERAPRKYELMTILHPEVEEESLPGELDRISGYIATAGGELIDSLRDSPWGRRRLAYPIRSGGRDVRDGYYTVWHFSIGPSRLEELERELKLNTQLIRYIVVSWEPKPIDPKEVEAAEIAAEEAAAAAYVAAQAAAAASEDAAAEAYAASEAAAAEAATATAAEAEAAGEPAEAASEPAEAAAMGLVADTERTAELTAEAEAIEATGAELAIEPIAAVEEREELEVEAAAALEKAAEAAAAESTQEETVIPAGAIRGDESGECPDDYPVKGNTSSMLYHTPGSPSYKRTNPEFCFASVEAAEAAGFGPTKYEAAQEEGAQEEGE
jgi:ribosomal protein S6